MDGQARAYLEQIPFWTRKKNTLDAIRDFLREMGNPQEHLNIIHVAGTNGKGSVCADLTAILKEAGYQARNAALAVKTLEILKPNRVDASVCRSGLSKVYWAGRMELVGDGIWLDGAHNTGGIRAFIEAVKQHGDTGKLQLLFAAVSDKDYQEMIRLLCEELSPKRVTVAHIDSARGLDSELLKRQFQDCGCQNVTAFTTTKEALQEAMRHKTKQDRLYIVGSLYLIGEMKKLFREMRK